MWLNEVEDYLFITLGLVMYAGSFVVFLMPYEIVAGGVTGLSAIIYYATGFHLENTYIIINVLLLMMALKILGVKFMVKTIYAIFVLYFLLIFFQEVLPKQDNGLPLKLLGEGQDFMSLVIGCAMTGIALAVVFMHNGSTGGTDIVAAAVNKYHNVSLGSVLRAADFCIVGSCMFFPQFGNYIERTHKVMFGFCVIAIESFTLDYVMNALRESVQFLIFSKKHREIAYGIGMKTGRGVTILDGHGWYTGQDMKVLCVLARRRESVDIFRLIKTIDSNAFVSQSSVIGVYGEGFDAIKVKASTNEQTEENATKMIFVTNNQHKLAEVKDILGDTLSVSSLADIGCHEDIQETGNTLEENALQKAEYIFERYGRDCFADDTGLEVEALGGEPGVHSARYAEGVGHDSEANMTKLLRKLEGKDNRRARFRTVIALIQTDEQGRKKAPVFFEGTVEGTIIEKRQGTRGFGYDPIFMPDGYNKTFAELGEDVKNHISHRARATQKLAEFLTKQVHEKA